MTCRTSLTVAIAVVCLFLSSCGKSNSKPKNNTSTSSTGTLNINCYPIFPGSQTEVIVSEAGGAILLDTVLNKSGSPLIASLKTNDTLVDVTQIAPQTGGPTTYVYTYKSVNLSRLSTLNIDDEGNVNFKRPVASTQSQIWYYNIPSQIDLNFDGSIFWANYPLNGETGATADPYGRTLQVGFENYQGDYAYLLFPEAGLYSLHLQQKAMDSVDCSHLDTAIQLTFNRPVPFTAAPYGSALYGILDTADLSKVISFADFSEISTKPGVDFEYASIPVQKYQMYYAAALSNNDVVSFYAYTKTLPQALPFPRGNDFSTSSAQADNFSVTFPNTKPSYYQLSLSTDSTIQYNIFVSPDSSNIHPVTFLTGLKSRFLQNARVSSLKLISFNMSNSSNLNYLDFYRYATNTSPIQALPGISVCNLTRNY